MKFILMKFFSFNEIYDNKVRVCIYYFDPKAKFALLNNLFHILGKEKVETWMKNGWLHFDENPNLVKKMIKLLFKIKNAFQFK